MSSPPIRARASRRRLRAVVAFEAAAALGAAAPALALDPEKSLSECTVDVFGRRDGLTGTMVRTIAQTSDGYLWIGGDGGIRRYDGARLVRLEMDPLRDVVGLLARGDGSVLVALPHGTPLCARRDTLGPCSPPGPQLTPQARVSFLDHDESGGVWIGTDGGLFRFTNAGLDAFDEWALLPRGAVSAVHRDGRGWTWVGTPEGLFVSRGGPFVPFPLPRGVIASPIRAILPSAQDRQWVVTDTTLARLSHDEVVVHDQPPCLGWRQAALEDRDGNVWIGTQGGLVRFRDGRFATYTQRDGLPDDDVTALFEDREGSLWVGTRSGALAQFTDRTVTTRAGPPSLRNVSIESLTEDASGTLWLGTWLGLTRFKDGRERTFTRADGLSDEHVYAVQPGRDGELWVATGKGIDRLLHGRFQPYCGYPTPLVSLYRDRGGSLWAATRDGLGLVANGRIEILPGLTAKVRCIAEDDRGTLWVTSDKGLARVGGGRVLLARHEGATVPADRGIYREPDGTLWFGADSELLRLRAGTIRKFVLSPGPARDTIHQLAADDLGNLWIATSRTILRIAKRDLDEKAGALRPGAQVVSFDTTDERREIAARRSRTPGPWKDHDGRLWFPTLRGVVTIDPARIRLDTQAPPVVIESAIVDGRRAEAGRSNAFPPGPGNAEFHFAGITLVEPRKVVHKYRLDGFDKDWIDAGARRVAYYTNLPPDRYRFRVRASNADGIWNESEAALDLAIAPHYYQTLWFYLACALGLAGGATALHRARLGRMRGQYLAVFAERSRVARELHDSLLQGMSAAALEIGNVRAELPASAGAAASRLAQIENAITASLEETRRFVWDLRGQTGGSGDLGLALSRLASRVSEGRLAPCTVQVEGVPVHLSHDIQGSLFRIAQEALVNSLRHADARRIDVRLSYQPGSVRLSVSDDGRGFEPAPFLASADGHFGLVGMQERARRLAAQILIDSDPGRGTKVEVVVPTGDSRNAIG